MRKISSLSLGLGLLLAASTAALAQNASNGQSVMVKINNPGPIVVTQDNVYQYNATTAAGHFTNTRVGTVSATCSGSSANVSTQFPQGGPCNPANRPAQPAAPAVLTSKLTDVVNISKCTFWSGGILDATTAYAQSLAVPVSVTKKTGNQTSAETGTWTFTYHYEVKADASQSTVGARTAWDLLSSNVDGSTEVTLSGIIAAQDTLIKAKAPAGHWKVKTSHNLVSGLDPITGLPVAQVSGLQATLWNGSTQVGDPINLDYTLHRGVDFEYGPATATMGSNPSFSGMVSNIHKGIGSTDDFAGNNNNLGDYVELAPFSFNVSEAGNYAVVVTGIVKSINLDGSQASTPFSVTLNFTYSTADDSCPVANN